MPERDPLTPAEREQRRRRLAAVFGDVLPDQTRDDRADGSDGSDGADGGAVRDSADERLRRDVPPHHGPVG